MEKKDNKKKDNEGKIIISCYSYDSDHFILFFSKNGKDVGLYFGICEFDLEMKSLLYECNQELVNGRIGFIFPNSESKEDVILASEAFIRQYRMNEDC